MTIPKVTAPTHLTALANHHFFSLNKTKDQPLTYAFCGGNYPANYHECIVYRDLQKFYSGFKTTVKNNINQNNYVNEGKTFVDNTPSDLPNFNDN